MITAVVPGTWQELQNQVGQLLRECGFTVEIEKRLSTVRGNVAVDVYAEESIEDRKYSIICECKHWRTRVPQTVVHGFRTVLADIGANAGYIISTSGFQEGSFEAIASTNTQLVTWLDFQNQFERTWFKSYMSPTLAERLDPLLTYTEPLLPKWFAGLTEDGKRDFLALKDRYDEFGWLIMFMTPYSHTFEDKGLPRLPLAASLSPNSSIRANVPLPLLEAQGLRDFLDLAIAFGEEVIAKFRALRPQSATDD
jgi:restriction system protein